MADVHTAMIGAPVLGGHPSSLIGTYFDTQYPTLDATDRAATITTGSAGGTAPGHDPQLGTLDLRVLSWSRSCSDIDDATLAWLAEHPRAGPEPALPDR